MSTSIVNVWITSLGDPCTIASDVTLPHAWVVAVSHCDGRVVNWSEGRYRFHHEDQWTQIPQHTPPGGRPGWWYDSIPTRDGHVEIELPPGCYVLRATMHSWFVNGQLYGNWATERAVVQACCGDDVCATLYAPSAMACSIPLFQFVIPLLIQNGIVKKDAGARAMDAMAAIFKPEAASAYERAEFDTLTNAFKQMEQPKDVQTVQPRGKRKK
ncbi:MAG TPA: hypothetical protein VKB86_11600 [Pyrinomonadaceae bacterium]|nr:hypothetical protein [Pyrinomonadaceae bacterium]